VIGIILDEPTDSAHRLFVDSNLDGDFTNDPSAEYLSRKQGERTMHFGSAMVHLGYSEPVSLQFYKFDPADPQRAALKATLLYYTDFGFQLKLNLDGKEYTGFVAGALANKSQISVDRNNDGQISPFKESIVVGNPFNFTGTTYEVTVKDGIPLLVKSAKSEPITPEPPNLKVGGSALKFDAVSLEGKPVKFPDDYKGKIVMLDFWATWCGPCIAELPNVKAAYEKWHSQGFEILGLSFDRANEEAKVKDFVTKNGMPWTHVYEGKFWETTIGKQYDVNAIPFVLLVDGDTGEILGDVRNLRGPGIVDFIGKTLAKKRSADKK
jgi:thiol-disulfide isomerase/thioredoxin